MPETLVAFYGDKPAAFARWIADLQEKAGLALGRDFQPYALPQVHATLIGLEAEEGVNENFLRLRGERRAMQRTAMHAFLKSTAFFPKTIRVGGFHPEQDYGFTSRGAHPFERSFFRQGPRLIAMGWPVDHRGRIDHSLDDFRRAFQPFNILHKYHADPRDIDNDFFFVLGTIDPQAMNEAEWTGLTAQLRASLANRPPLYLNLRREDVSIVSYADPQLPWGKCAAVKITESTP